ncbi:MAG: hypothetical protein ACREVN_01685 [Gammaproteobacteria bacterium]
MRQAPLVMRAACTLLAFGLGFTAGPAAAGRDPGPVRDLHYGEVLFHFYQDDYFNSLTHLLAARKQHRVSHHSDEAELLLGGLYLSYGQHDEAGRIFERLLDTGVTDEVRDRAWFFLAKIRYQRGYLDEADRALAAIEGPMPEPLEAEKQLLHAQVLLSAGRYDEAIDLLDRWQGPEQWVGYAKFNLGVALVRVGRLEEGARLLDEVGMLRVDSEELKSLRDKANLALGYARLQNAEPELAKPVLQRVRLEGAFSNKALLGAGWADSAEERYGQALVPWLALSRRNLLDSAAQESMLAIPYAYAQLADNGEAADRYSRAIDAFRAEIVRLDESIAWIREGRLADTLLEQEASDGTGWFWRLDELPDSRESRYLYHLMARHEFQEGLKAYRDLRELDRNLAGWAASIVAFRAMLEAQELAYEKRLPLIESSLDGVDIDALVARRVELAAKLDDIERRQDAVALGTSRERRQWAALEAIGRELDRLPEGPAVSEARDKHRLLHGVLLWNVERDYKARLWRERQSLRELERAVSQAQKRHYRVDAARRAAPEKFVEFGARIESIAPRITAMRLRVAHALEGQQDHLQALAIDELERQKGRLDAYTVQARFALATIYDRLSAGASMAEASP